jgi:hypothetical protein
MPAQPDPNDRQEEPKSITILQINLNKSEKAHLDIINEQLSQNYDILLIQEPYTTTFNMIRTPANFRQVIPINRFQDDAQIRSVIWVNKRLDTKDWIILDVPESNDITAIQLKGPYAISQYSTSITTVPTQGTKQYWAITYDVMQIS